MGPNFSAILWHEFLSPRLFRALINSSTQHLQVNMSDFEGKQLIPIETNPEKNERLGCTSDVSIVLTAAVAKVAG